MVMDALISLVLRAGYYLGSTTMISTMLGFQGPSVFADSMTGFEIADINGDGLIDLIAGSSRGPRMGDGDVTAEDALGRIGWSKILAT